MATKAEQAEAERITALGQQFDSAIKLLVTPPGDPVRLQVTVPEIIDLTDGVDDETGEDIEVQVVVAPEQTITVVVSASA